MALTGAEEKRLREAEQTLVRINKILDGAASKNQLNRLYVLLLREVEELSNAASEIEEKVNEVLEYARKAQ